VLVLGLDPVAHRNGAYMQFLFATTAATSTLPCPTRTSCGATCSTSAKALEGRLPVNLRHTLVAEGLREQEARPDVVGALGS